MGRLSNQLLNDCGNDWRADADLLTKATNLDDARFDLGIRIVTARMWPNNLESYGTV